VSASESQLGTRKIRAIVVDDERLSRRDMLAMLEPVADVETIGEAETAAEARRLISELQPDLAFLDIRMPEEDGLQLAASLDGHNPLIIFTTAVTTRALEAFSVKAVDYLLKPVEPDRLEAALERARILLSSRPSNGSEAPSKYLKRLVVRDGRNVFFVKTSDLVWFESEENYVRLHLLGKNALSRCTLSALHAQLDPEVFIQVRRDAVLNLDFIERAEQIHDRRILLHMGGGHQIVASRSCSKAIFDKLELHRVQFVSGKPALPDT